MNPRRRPRKLRDARRRLRLLLVLVGMLLLLGGTAYLLLADRSPAGAVEGVV